MNHYELRGRIEHTKDICRKLETKIMELATRIMNFTSTEDWFNDPLAGEWLQERSKEFNDALKEKKSLSEQLNSLKREYKELTDKEV